MDTQAPVVSPMLPSLHHLKCPHCGGAEYRILGQKGSQGKSFGYTMALGAVGAMIANSQEQNNQAIEPTNFKCGSCGKKFDSMPLAALQDEILPQPATVSFKRAGSFVGMAVMQFVWLNGIKVAAVKNGQTVEFPVYTRFNTLFVTDQFGVAFKGDFKFEAQPGGRTEALFKRKFK